MNPSRMRNTYGKLMYILMDCESNLFKSEIKIDFVKPILTIIQYLYDHNIKDMVTDKLLYIASPVYMTHGGDKEQNETAKKMLFEKYVNGRCTMACICMLYLCILYYMHYITTYDIHMINL